MKWNRLEACPPKRSFHLLVYLCVFWGAFEGELGVLPSVCFAFRRTFYDKLLWAICTWRQKTLCLETGWQRNPFPNSPFRILLVSFIYIFVLVPRCSLRWASGTPLASPQTVTWPSSSADARLSWSMAGAKAACSRWMLDDFGFGSRRLSRW